MYKFSSFLKELRKEAQITQAQLAKILGVSPVLIAMLETEQKPVSRKILLKLAQALEIHPAVLSNFVFQEDHQGSLSVVEKKLLGMGKRLQKELIKKKAKKLASYANE